jgi:DNA-binding Lrp family transcriptional regulator
MDDLDHQILEKLQENDKLSYKKIGKTLKKPASTIHFRVKKMIDDKIIVKFSAIVDMEKLGYNTVGWLGLTIDPLMRDEIIKKLSSYKLIKIISSTTGDYNLILQILAENEKKLWNFIRDNIQTVEGVHEIHVSSSLKVHKWETAYFLKI